jgi:hypothetical protein
MSAFNTRSVKGPEMFVRTHVAFYFVSLLLSDILQGEFFCLYAHPRGIHDLACMAMNCRAGTFPTSNAYAPYSFAAIGSIINAAWMNEQAVVYGSLCTAQGGGMRDCSRRIR